MKRLESEPITALEVALLFYEELMRRPRWFNRKFYDDLKRYPKALQKTEEEKSRFLKKCIKLLSRGAKEGVFQPNSIRFFIPFFGGSLQKKALPF